MMDFGSLLTAEQKRSLVEGRIAQFAAEAYQHTLNKQTAENLGAEQQVEQANRSLAVLEEAIKVHQAELDSLPAPAPEAAE